MPESPKLPTISPSPLAEADPESIKELMARDPQMLTDPDVEKIVAVLRKGREAWQEADQKKQAAPKVLKKTATKEDLEGVMKDLLG